MIRSTKCIPLFVLMFIAGCGGRKQIKKVPAKQMPVTSARILRQAQDERSRSTFSARPELVEGCEKGKNNVGIGSKKPRPPVKKLPVKNYKRSYTIIIEGMTCPVCEKSALYRLRKIKGITNIAVQGHNEASEEHILLITWKSKENLPLGAIVDAVEKEDFILHQLTGKLRGRFIDQDRKKQFIVQGTGEPFALTRAVGNGRPIQPQIWERVQKDTLFWVNLTIWRDSDDGVYKIALNRAHH